MLNPFAKPDQVARHLKIAVTGKSGTGKTCFGLDAKNHGQGPVAVLSNESGDVHYVGSERWGGFDRLPTQSIKQIELALDFLETNPGHYKTLVIDTVTGIYEGLVDAKAKEDGSVNKNAWGLIKRKWKSLMVRLNNLPINIVCVVHENDIVEEDDKGKFKIVGQKLDAEKTFERNPDVLIRLGVSEGKRAARVLKDRTMTFQTGQVIADPTIGMWAKAIRGEGHEARVAPPEEVAKANEEAMSGAAPKANGHAGKVDEQTMDEIARLMEVRCKKGFATWDEKKEWADHNKPLKDALSTDRQLLVSKAFMEAEPRVRPKDAPAPTQEQQ